METTTHKIADMGAHFAEGRRADGERYTYLADTAPEWLSAAIYRAHDDEMPNDWRYDMCQRIVAEFADFDCELGERIGSDMRHHICDSLNMFTNYDVLAWASGNLSRLGYAQDYYDEVGSPSANGDETFHADPLAGLRVAIYQCVRVMVDEMADAWEDADA